MRGEVVMVIATNFPPNPVGGVMRVAKLCKYLTRSGWEPVVVTSGIRSQDPATFGLLQDVDHITALYRMPALDLRKPFHLLRNVVRVPATWFRRSSSSTQEATATAPASTETVGSPLAARFLVPDHLLLWVPLALLASLFAVARHRPALVFSTAPLPSANLVAMMVSRICRIPWVMDMRDPWTTNPFAVIRSLPLLGRIEHALENRCLLAADRIVVVSEAFIPPIQASFPAIKRSLFTVIPNGYDPEDFLAIKPRQYDRFALVHAGSFYTGRSPEVLFLAIRKMLDRHPDYIGRFRLHLLGNVGAEVEQMVARHHLSPVVALEGNVEHARSLASIAGADLLLLIPGKGKSTMTGKIFEYMAAGKPVFAIAGEGVVRDLVVTDGLGVVVDPDDPDVIATQLQQCIDGHIQRMPQDAARCGRYSREKQAQIMMSIFDELINQKKSGI